MATPTLTWYPKGAVSCWSGAVLLASATIKALLLDNTYSYDKAHQFVSDVSAKEHDGSGYARVTAAGMVVVLSGDGLAAVTDLNDITFLTVGTGTNPLRYVALYAEVTDDTDSPLLLVMDVGSNLTPAGASIIVVWPSSGVAVLTNQTAGVDPAAPSVFQAVEGESNGTSDVTMLTGIAGAARIIRTLTFINETGGAEGILVEITDGTNTFTVGYGKAVADDASYSPVPSNGRFTLPDENWAITMKLDSASGAGVKWYLEYENA